MRITTKRRGAWLGLFAAAALTLAACSTEAADTNAGGNDAGAASAAANQSGMMTPFGPACSAVPAAGSGSFSGMAADPVATAASNNPALSTLVTAATKADLVDTLNGASDITVFAPTDEAFASMDQKTLKAALADPKGLLTTVLTYHVVPGTLTPADLAGTHKTLEGDSLKITGSGEDFTVNGAAKVVCGDVQTSNATVYIIDGVLAPTMKSAGS